MHLFQMVLEHVQCGKSVNISDIPKTTGTIPICVGSPQYKILLCHIIFWPNVFFTYLYFKNYFLKIDNLCKSLNAI